MSGTVTATSGITLPDWVNQAALQNYQTAMGLSQQPYTAYPGTIVAPFSTMQNQALTSLQGLPSTAPAFGAATTLAQGVPGAAAPLFNAATGATQNIPALTNLPGATQSLLNPYLGSVEADTVSNIQRAAALQGQQIAAAAQQGGAYGGTRYGVEQATLDSETQRNIGQAINQIQSQGYNTAMQTALQQGGMQLSQGGQLANIAGQQGALGLNTAQMLAGLASGGQNAALQALGAQLQGGGTQQEQQQAQLSAQLAQWQQQQNWPYQQLAVAQGALAGSPYGTTTTSSQPYTTSTLANALSTGAAALPAIGGLTNSLFGSNGILSGMFGTSNTPGTMTTSNVGGMNLNLPNMNAVGLTGSGTYNYGSGALSSATNTDTSWLGNIGSDVSSAASGVGNWISDAASSIGSSIGSIF